MKNTIKEVQDYFKNKILSGDFIITEATIHTATFIIDEEFTFTFWTANDGLHCDQYLPSYPNFIKLPKATTEEHALYFAAISPLWKEQLKGTILSKKQEAAEKLQAEIKAIENS